MKRATLFRPNQAIQSCTTFAVRAPQRSGFGFGLGLGLGFGLLGVSPRSTCRDNVGLPHSRDSSIIALPVGALATPSIASASSSSASAGAASGDRPAQCAQEARVKRRQRSSSGDSETEEPTLGVLLPLVRRSTLRWSTGLVNTSP